MLFKTVLFLLFLFFGANLYSQETTDQETESSLNYLYNKDLNKVDIEIRESVRDLNIIAQKTDFLHLSNSLVKYYPQLIKKGGKEYYFYYLSLCYESIKNYNRAFEYLAKAKNGLTDTYVYEEFARIYEHDGNQNKALKYYKLQEKESVDSLMKFRANRNIGLCFYRSYKLDSALLYLQKSNRFLPEYHETFSLLNDLSIALIHKKNGFINLATEQLKELFNRSENTCRVQFEIGLELIECYEDTYEFEAIPDLISELNNIKSTQDFDLKTRLLRYELVYSPVNNSIKREKLIDYKKRISKSGENQPTVMFKVFESIKTHDSLNSFIEDESINTDILNNENNQGALRSWIIGLSLLFTLGFVSIYLHNKNRISSRIKILQKERSELHKRIAQQNKELTDLAINLRRKRQFDEEFLKKVESVKNSNFSHKEQLNKLSIELKNQVGQGHTHEILQENIDQLNFRFYASLSEKHPSLTKNDKDLCGLIRLNFTNKEIASLKNISSQSARTAKYRLKQKLELDSEIDLTDYLQSI